MRRDRGGRRGCVYGTSVPSIHKTKGNEKGILDFITDRG